MNEISQPGHAFFNPLECMRYGKERNVSKHLIYFNVEPKVNKYENHDYRGNIIF